MHVFMYVYMCLCILACVGGSHRDPKKGVSELIGGVTEGRILVPQNDSK